MIWLIIGLIMVVVSLLAMLFVGIKVLMYPGRYLKPSLSRDFHPNAPYNDEYHNNIPYNDRRCNLVLCLGTTDFFNPDAPPAVEATGSGGDAQIGRGAASSSLQTSKQQPRIFCICQETGLFLMACSMSLVYQFHPREGSQEPCRDCYYLELFFGVILPIFSAFAAIISFYHINLTKTTLRLWRRIATFRKAEGPTTDEVQHEKEPVIGNEERHEASGTEKSEPISIRTQDIEQGGDRQAPSDSAFDPPSERPTVGNKAPKNIGGILQGIASGLGNGYARRETPRSQFYESANCIVAPGYYWVLASKIWYTLPPSMLFGLVLDFVWERARTR